MTKHYDYMITGAGCAGLSLLMRLLQEPELNNKSILVIDERPKTENDRTWCFWEKQPGLFESIVCHSWQQVNFRSPAFTAKLDLQPYTYKMIRGIDFYNHVIQYAQQFLNVEFRYEKVLALQTANTKAVAQLANEQITADYIFNSIVFEKPVIKKGEFYLLQHFKGWVIETEEPAFDASVATFMDFSVNQKHGTTFMYVMPVLPNKALVEYTLFTGQLLQPDDYEDALKQYIAQNLGISNYTIQHTEFGVIPMTNHVFAQQQGNIVYMGVAGGQAKGSSGYAFQFIQKRTAAIVASLLHNNHPFTRQTCSDKKFHLYDSVLLHVLHQKKINGDKIFADIFKTNKPSTVLKFLDNESSIWEDLKIMNSVDTKIFLRAAFAELFK